MANNRDKKVSVVLNIMLLNTNYSINEAVNFIKDYNEDNVIHKTEGDFILYKRNSFDAYPDWLKKFDQKIWKENILPQMSKTNSEGLSLIKNIVKDEKNYLFAINFGSGRFNVEKAAINKTFGMYTTQKIIHNKQAKIKHSQTRSIEDNPINKNRMFGDDVEQDTFFLVMDDNEVIRELNISIDNPQDFSSMIGKYGSLNVRLRFNEDEIPCFDHLDNKLVKLIELFESITEEEISMLFKGLQPIEKGKEDSLFEQLIQLIPAENNGFFLFEPEVDFDYTRISGFNYKCINDGAKTENNSVKLDLNNYLELQPTPTLENLQSDSIAVLDEDGKQIKSWSIIECLYGEMELEGQIYILSHEKWFKIEKDKYKRITRDIKRITDNSFIISNSVKENTTASIKKYMGTPEYQKSKKVPKERLFNESLCNERHGEFFDKSAQQIHIEGNKIEVCDIFLPVEKEFLHSKIGNSSATLSHLFNQGYVSGRSFAILKESYIPAVNAKILTLENQIGNDHKGYTIRYLIINTSTKNELTFFSKMALDSKISDLEAFGYNVKLTWVNGVDLCEKVEETNSD